MAPTIVASTPSPPPGIRTPPTPRHGYSDPWEPFSPRKSARISSQQAANRTPSPRSSRNDRISFRATKNTHLLPATTAATGIVSPFSTPQKKHRSSSAMDPEQGPHRLTAESSAVAAASLGIDNIGKSGATTISQRTGMLPTPAKTPKKPPTEKNPAIQAIARNLFTSDDEILPSPKRRRAKKYTGISMDSFTAETVEDPIQIFTDSHDRVPEKDESAENPFFGNAAVPEEPARRRSKRKQVVVPGEGRQTLEEAMKREDGMVYVFRGKKIFRKFADSEPADNQDGEFDAEGDASRRAHMTRSSIKPRLLFPVDQAQQGGATEDEEADTDVEDPNMGAVDPATPTVSRRDSLPTTPETPKFGPISPPDTRRVTRAGDKKSDDGTPVKSRSRTSPFDSWPRVKRGAEVSAPKRHGDALAPTMAKKARA